MVNKPSLNWRAIFSGGGGGCILEIITLCLVCVEFFCYAPFEVFLEGWLHVAEKAILMLPQKIACHLESDKDVLHIKLLGMKWIDQLFLNLANLHCAHC